MLTGEHWQKLLLGHWHRQIRDGSRQLAEKRILFRGVLDRQVLQELNQLDQLILKHAGLSELGGIQSSCRGGRQKSLIILQQVYMVCARASREGSLCMSPLHRWMSQITTCQLAADS